MDRYPRSLQIECEVNFCLLIATTGSYPGGGEGSYRQIYSTENCASTVFRHVGRRKTIHKNIAPVISILQFANCSVEITDNKCDAILFRWIHGRSLKAFKMKQLKF